MNRWILAVLLIATVVSAFPARAQSSVTVVEPSGGATIEHLFLHEQGWGWVVFAETLSPIAGCTAIASGNWASAALVGRLPIWINLSSTAVSGKQLYNTLLLAHQLGRKVLGFGFWQPNGTWCELFGVRVAPA